ncbi:MAG: type III secretion system stator protein SctL [Ectothiorhodospiraceae bacterium]|nr:type III secretion system stator protein SctL [Ectothiorhodospiraceae bacterium]MCH8503877.1 type III secretion system stator protein SctL [Ectothiorhodospiraceae bacterium]
MRNPVVRLDRSALALAHGRVVKAETFARLTEAEEIVTEARQHAAAVRAQIQEEQELARRDGLEQGREAGRAELATALAEATGRIESAFLGLEARIVNTVMHAVQEILGDTGERAVMERAIRRVLTQARSETRLRLRVAEADFPMVNALLTEILTDHPDITFVDIAKDPKAAAGTCVLETDFGVVDASIDTQLAAVRGGLINAFVGQRRPAEGADGSGGAGAA